MINVLTCQFAKFTNLLENIIYSKSLKIFLFEMATFNKLRGFLKSFSQAVRFVTYI